MVHPKKHLGQHFLKDKETAKKIVDALKGHGGYQTLLEVGPGVGILTEQLLSLHYDLIMVELDREAAAYLRKRFNPDNDRLLEMDFLKYDISGMKDEGCGIIGNFPYNISSQIFFKVFENHETVREVVCMVQEEVARRIASPPGNRVCGILSIFIQLYYNVEYLFQVPPEVFNPPPKVNSGVIRLTRNDRKGLECDAGLFKSIVKQGFQNRRKTLKNALKPLHLPGQITDHPFMQSRAEQLGPDDYVLLSKLVEKSWSK